MTTYSGEIELRHKHMHPRYSPHGISSNRSRLHPLIDNTCTLLSHYPKGQESLEITARVASVCVVQIKSLIKSITEGKKSIIWLTALDVVAVLVRPSPSVTED